MGHTALRQRGADANRLTDKMRRFAHEYPIDYNGKRAAIAAGYPAKTASVMAVKLLKNPLIAAIVGKSQRQTLDKLELTKEEILKQLYYMATRDGAEFVDPETGILLPIHKLSPRASQCINGIKQKVRTWVDRDGEEHREVETDYKIVAKEVAIDLAMKHKGLFAPDQHEHTIKVDWDSLVSNSKPEPDLIEARIFNPRLTHQPKEPEAPLPDVRYTVDELSEEEPE